MDLCLVVVFRVYFILHEPFPLGSVRGDSVLAPRCLIAPENFEPSESRWNPSRAGN
jgi:hypothetical protein